MGNPGTAGEPTFLAIDFETADYGSDSACAIGLVRVEKGRIVRKEAHLIRPPRQRMVFTYIHGLTWKDVQDAPDFGALWPRIRELFDGVEFLAAHNASFDRRVLEAVCGLHAIEPPRQEFRCTVRLARQAWGLKPARLPDVCRHLGLELNHHEALSDALACAEIVLRAPRTA